METSILASVTDPAVGPELAKARTGIPGLDDVTGGGLPRGRVTLVTGGPGTGKTLLGLEFLVAGASEYGEPGVLVTFEGTKSKVGANVRSLGIDLAQLEADGKLAVLAFQLELGEIVAAGDFDFSPLFAILADAIDRVGATRVVLDTIEVLFGPFGDNRTVRSELSRLAHWLEERGVTAIVTGERADTAATVHGIADYVSDCVIVLDHRVNDEVSTRRLRIVKYRGSVHGTNEYPFVISTRGLVMLPLTSIALDYSAPTGRISTGIGRLDRMLGGGAFKGSTIMVSGAAGTGKTSVGAHLVDAACARGERALWVLFEESPAQVLRNMGSLGLNLQQWIDAGLLRIWAGRPATFGVETHLAILAGLIEEFTPAVAVLDGVVGVGMASSPLEAATIVGRQIDLFKTREITACVTVLGLGGEADTSNLSSMVDTWLLLRNIEMAGERNRLLVVLKSRGTAHSNQVREFVLSDHGIELVDVSVGPEGVLAGSSRLTQLANERNAEVRRGDELVRRRHELRRSIAEREAHLVDVQRELDAERAEVQQMERREQRRTTAATADEASMAASRWADADAVGADR